MSEAKKPTGITYSARLLKSMTDEELVNDLVETAGRHFGADKGLAQLKAEVMKRLWERS